MGASREKPEWERGTYGGEEEREERGVGEAAAPHAQCGGWEPCDAVVGYSAVAARADAGLPKAK